MWGYDHGGGLMGFGMILVWLLPAVVLVWLFTGILRRGTGSGDAPNSPREILEARYARGDIGREEYLQRRADLDTPGKG